MKHFRGRIHGRLRVPYAEGVTFRSPGSAKPRSGGAPPRGCVQHGSVTPKALYKGSDGMLVCVERLRRTHLVGNSTRGARAPTAAPRCPRPRAMECNRFAVKSLREANLDAKMLHSVDRRGYRAGSRNRLGLLRIRGIQNLQVIPHILLRFPNRIPNIAILLLPLYSTFKIVRLWLVFKLKKFSQTY